MYIKTDYGESPNILHFHGENITQLNKTFNLIKNKLVVDNKMSNKLQVVSCWTDDEKCSVLEQCRKNNIPLTNAVPDDYDRSSQWYMPNKIHFFLDILRKSDKEIILFLDGYDVLITHLNDIVSKFESQKYRILFNASCNNYPDVSIDKLYGRTRMGTYRYFNAGCVIGYREDLIKFYEESLEFINKPNPLNSEQFVMRHAFKRYALDKDQTFVGIDYKCKIFKSMGYTHARYVPEFDSFVFNKTDYQCKKRVIVTGSDGFIGQVLCEKLRGMKDVEVLEIDRKNGTEASDVPSLLKTSDIDCVFHLAAQTSVFNDNLQQIADDNIKTFIDIAMACERYGTKLVYTSSSTANGKNTTSMYGLSKKFDEEFASIYAPGATGVRLHNVWSETPREGTLYWHLLHDKDVTKLYNGGSNIRCFTYVEDAVDGIISAWESDEALLNCVNQEPLTVLQFAEIAKEFNPDIKFEKTYERRNMDNKQQVVDKSIPIIKLKYKKVRDAFEYIKNKQG